MGKEGKPSDDFFHAMRKAGEAELLISKAYHEKSDVSGRICEVQMDQASLRKGSPPMFSRTILIGDVPEQTPGDVTTATEGTK